MGSGTSDRPRRSSPKLTVARPARARDPGGAGDPSDPGLPGPDREAGPHPRIPPWRRPIARTTGEIQFGVSAGGPIVTGVSEAEARVLARLDGTVPLDTSYRFAGEVGIPARRWRALLDLIEEIGVLERFSPEQPCPAVLLEGRERCVEELCHVLRRGGIDALVGAPHGSATRRTPSRRRTRRSSSCWVPWHSTRARATHGFGAASRTCRWSSRGRVPPSGRWSSRRWRAPACGASTCTAPTVTRPGPSSWRRSAARPATWCTATPSRRPTRRWSSSSPAASLCSRAVSPARARRLQEWRSSSVSPGHGWTTAGGRRTPGAHATTPPPQPRPS